MFVCLGNICRSPLAEGIARKQLNENGLQDKVEIASSGTGDYHVGEDADPRARACAEKNGVPMQHTAQQLVIEHQEEFDYVLAMDEDNLANVRSLFKREGKAKVFLIRQFAESPTPMPVSQVRPHLRSVPDPYWGGDDGFQDVFDMLNSSVDHFIEYLKIQHDL